MAMDILKQCIVLIKVINVHVITLFQCIWCINTIQYMFTPLDWPDFGLPLESVRSS